MGGWLTDWITDRIADVVTWIISAVSAGFAALASTITKFVMDLALSASPDMNAEFLLTWYRRIFAVGIPVVVILAAIQVMTSTAATSRADSALKALTGAVKAILASMLALPLVTLFVTAADSTADALWGTAKADMDASVNNFSQMIVTQPAASEMNLGELLENRGNLVVALLMLVFSLLSIIASILLWLVLVIRDNLLYVCVVALPLAFSGLAWSGSANWPKKILKWILALAFCKIGIVVLLGMGSTALASATSSDAAFTTRASAMLSFVALSTIGGFMPSVAFKFFDFVGGEFEMARVTQDVIDSGRGAVSAVSGANESLSNALQSANSGSGSSGGSSQLAESLGSQGSAGTAGAGGAETGAAGGASSGAAAGAAGAAAGVAVAAGKAGADLTKQVAEDSLPEDTGSESSGGSSQLAESVGSASTSGDPSASGADRSVNSGSDRDTPEMASESVDSELTRGGLGQPAGGSGEEVSDSGLA